MKKSPFLAGYLLLALVFVFTSCGKDDEIEEVEYTPEKEETLLRGYLDHLISNNYDIDTTANGVYYVVMEEGTGNVPQPGDKVSVSYNGLFIGGGIFDSSGNPSVNGYVTFTHRVDNMIDGWEEGIETIKEGGTSLLIVPSSLAYGKNGHYSIPPYTTLLFTIYVHKIVPAE